MVGVMFILLLSIFGYFGYKEAVKIWKKYLEDRLAAVKEAEIAVVKNISSNASRAVNAPAEKTSDIEFQALLERNFINWARIKGLIR